jgi:hypothetical protein
MDHVNGDRADNRWCNLREATQSQNQANTSMRADNISGYKGVCWHKVTANGPRRFRSAASAAISAILTRPSVLSSHICLPERTIAATFDRGGPNYRELRELFRVLHMAYEETKKLFDELVDDDEQ